VVQILVVSQANRKLGPAHSVSSGLPTTRERFHSMDTSAFNGIYPVELPTTGLVARNSFRLARFVRT